MVGNLCMHSRKQGKKYRERTKGRKGLMQKDNLRQGEGAHELETKAKQAKNRVKIKTPGFRKNISEHCCSQHAH